MMFKMEGRLADADKDEWTQDPSDPAWLANGAAVEAMEGVGVAGIREVQQEEKGQHTGALYGDRLRQQPQQRQQQGKQMQGGSSNPQTVKLKRKPRFMVYINVLQCHMEDPTYFMY